jgi:predicted small secreted protein
MDAPQQAFEVAEQATRFHSRTGAGPQRATRPIGTACEVEEPGQDFAHGQQGEIRKAPAFVAIETGKAMKKIILAVMLAVYALAIVGCKHTAHGVGQDVEKAGEKIQEKTN